MLGNDPAIVADHTVPLTAGESLRGPLCRCPTFAMIEIALTAIRSLIHKYEMASRNQDGLNRLRRMLVQR
jgi:hypothetical protein